MLTRIAATTAISTAQIMIVAKFSESQASIFLSPVHNRLFRHFNAFGQFCRLVIALDEQHIHHHRKHGDCRNQTDDIQTAGKRRAKLVDHQANRIRKHALI